MTPTISVIIPTYNRAALLRRTLESLEAQRLPAGELEVVVADDGSSDDTREVVRLFEPRLRLRYHFQADEGFRAAAARNAGARLATAAVLAFVDTGVLAGPDFARMHRDAHAPADAPPATGPRAVLGRVYGYNTEDPWPELASVLDRLDAEEAVVRFGADPRFRDMREDIFMPVNSDLRRLFAPWYLCWTVNLSVRAVDFWAVGGFDEDFCGWGGEDQDLGYRLMRAGVELVASPLAWGIEIPHERASNDNLTSSVNNALLFLYKHPDPVVELYYSLYLSHQSAPRLSSAYAEFSEGYRALCEWTARARAMDVENEVARAVEQALEIAGKSACILVLGCGGAVPPSLPDWGAVMDFDGVLLARALADGRYWGRHCVGIATTLRDTFDVVIISSRLAGLWDRWGGLVLAEADRLAPVVLVPFLQAHLRAL